MKAVMRKAGEIALAVLLITLICLPLPAMSAFAEDVEGETPERSELTPEQLLKLKQLQAAEATDDAEATETSTEADATTPTTTGNTTEDEAAAEGSTADDTSADSENDTATDSDNASESDDMTDDAKAIEPETNDDTEVTAPVAEQPADDAATTTAKLASADAATVSTADELKAAFTAANSHTGTYTITLAADIDLPETLTVDSGKSVTIEGASHTITLESATALNVAGTLTLNGTLTIAAASSHTGSLITVQGGTLNMNSGVTLEGNNDSASAGGGVSLTNKATFNMNGGTIENCTAGHGGGVYVSGSTFNMSGDATIQNCRAYGAGGNYNGDGGGVFMAIEGRTGSAQMTMSGNAAIRNNTASSTGGGVQMETRTTLTMEGNASITDNSADAGGGVMSYGMATLTTVYNNTTHSGAADIFNMGRLKLSPVNTDWVLKSTGTHVTGWYTDPYSQTDDDGNQAGGTHRWKPEDDASVEYVPTDGFATQPLYLIAGAPLPRVKVIWENEDGTVLYQEEVKTDEVPAADEYAELSGNDEPTEPPTSEGLTHEFTGWTETHPSDDEVVYIANYKLVDPHTEEVVTPDDPTPGTDDPVPEPGDSTTPETDDPTTPSDGSTTPAVIDPTSSDVTPQQAGTYSGTTSEATNAAGAALQQTGDQSDRALAALAALLGISAVAFGATMAARKREQ